MSLVPVDPVTLHPTAADVRATADVLLEAAGMVHNCAYVAFEALLRQAQNEAKHGDTPAQRSAAHRRAVAIRRRLEQFESLSDVLRASRTVMSAALFDAAQEAAGRFAMQTHTPSLTTEDFCEAMR